MNFVSFYTTHYTGRIYSGSADEADVAASLYDILRTYLYFPNDRSYYNTIDSVIGDDYWHWNDMYEDMAIISAQFPDTIIVISGEGEDSNDLWRAYFQNGKSVCYRAEIVYPPFNPEDLE